MLTENNIDKKILIAVGILGVLAVTGFLWISTPIGMPTDTEIVDILKENEENLLSIEGVVGAGIARDENNYIIGIAVYVEDNMTNVQNIPSKLGEYEVFIKRISEASDFEKEKMIIKGGSSNVILDRLGESDSHPERR